MWLIAGRREGGTQPGWGHLPGLKQGDGIPMARQKSRKWCREGKERRGRWIIGVYMRPRHGAVHNVPNCWGPIVGVRSQNEESLISLRTTSADRDAQGRVNPGRGHPKVICPPLSLAWAGSDYSISRIKLAHIRITEPASGPILAIQYLLFYVSSAAHRPRRRVTGVAKKGGP